MTSCRTPLVGMPRTGWSFNFLFQVVGTFQGRQCLSSLGSGRKVSDPKFGPLKCCGQSRGSGWPGGAFVAALLEPGPGASQGSVPDVGNQVPGQGRAGVSGPAWLGQGEAREPSSTHAWMDSVTEPIWLTLSSRQLQAFFSTAWAILLGLVTVRSSPTIWMSTPERNEVQVAQSSWSKGSSMETTGWS